MARKRLPDLRETGRMYVDRTRGGRLVSPGLERHVVSRRRVPVLLVAAVLLVALALFVYWRL
jgi:hypothetical protein